VGGRADLGLSPPCSWPATHEKPLGRPATVASPATPAKLPALPRCSHVLPTLPKIATLRSLLGQRHSAARQRPLLPAAPAALSTAATSTTAAATAAAAAAAATASLALPVTAGPAACSGDPWPVPRACYHAEPMVEPRLRAAGAFCAPRFAGGAAIQLRMAAWQAAPTRGDQASGALHSKQRPAGHQPSCIASSGRQGASSLA
jgi:hypothetical protein